MTERAVIERSDDANTQKPQIFVEPQDEGLVETQSILRVGSRIIEVSQADYAEMLQAYTRWDEARLNDPIGMILRATEIRQDKSYTLEVDLKLRANLPDLCIGAYAVFKNIIILVEELDNDSILEPKPTKSILDLKDQFNKGLIGGQNDGLNTINLRYTVICAPGVIKLPEINPPQEPQSESDSLKEDHYMNNAFNHFILKDPSLQ